MKILIKANRQDAEQLSKRFTEEGHEVFTLTDEQSLVDSVKKAKSIKKPYDCIIVDTQAELELAKYRGDTGWVPRTEISFYYLGDNPLDENKVNKVIGEIVKQKGKNK